MGWGDAAAAAFSKAVEALQAIAEVKAVMQQVQLQIANHEQRQEARLVSLETRIRELERENTKLHGQVHSAYGEALKILMLDKQQQLRDRERFRDLTKPAIHADGDGTVRTVRTASGTAEHETEGR
jgi:hypothetical protein